MAFNPLTKPSTFSEAFRQNVTINQAVCAMLTSEEMQGQNKFATQIQIAIENMHSDIITLSEVHSGFSPKTTEDQALNELIRSAYSLLEQDQDLLPDEAITQIIENHQKRRFPTVESAQERARIVNQAFAMAGHFLKKCEVA